MSFWKCSGKLISWGKKLCRFGFHYQFNYFFCRATRAVDGTPNLMYLLSRGILDHNLGGVFALTSNRLDLAYFWTKGKIMERLLPESLLTEMTSMAFPPFHRFYDILNLKIQQLFVCGIVQRETQWNKFGFNKLMDLSFDLEGPKVLTMQDMQSGFLVWLVSVSFAFVAFLLEWIAKACEMCLIRFVENK